MGRDIDAFQNLKITTGFVQICNLNDRGRQVHVILCCVFDQILGQDIPRNNTHKPTTVAE